MTHTVLFQCPINAEITTADSQSGLRILLLLRLINYIININLYFSLIIWLFNIINQYYYSLICGPF